MKRAPGRMTVTLTVLVFSIVLAEGWGTLLSAQGKGKGKPSSDVPLCVNFGAGLITGDGNGDYCASQRKTTAELQIDNGSNDLILNLGTSRRSRVYHIDLSNPASNTVGEECPVAFEDVFFDQQAFFFNLDQVASVPLEDTPANDVELMAFCGGPPGPSPALCGQEEDGSIFVRRRAGFRLLEEGALQGTVTRIHFRPQDHANTPFDSDLIDRPEATSYLKVRHSFDENDLETWEITPEDPGRATLTVWGPGKDDIFNCGQLEMSFKITAVREEN